MISVTNPAFSLRSWNTHGLIVVSLCWKWFHTSAGDFERLFFAVWADFEKRSPVSAGYLHPDDGELFPLPPFLSFHGKTNPPRSDSQGSSSEWLPNSSCLNSEGFAEATALKASRATQRPCCQRLIKMPKWWVHYNYLSARLQKHQQLKGSKWNDPGLPRLPT